MLRLEVKEEFNERSEDFTLEEIFKLHFLEFENDIIALTDEAQKQLKVEKDLLEIKRVWEEDSSSDLYIVKERSKVE